MTTGSTRPDQSPNGQPAKAKRRRFSDGYRLRILEEADRCTKPGEVPANDLDSRNTGRGDD